MQRDADEGLASRIDIGRGEHRGDAGSGLRGLDVDRQDLRMRMRAAHEAGMQHARQLDVVDVAAVAAQQPLQLAAWDAGADAGGGRGLSGHASVPFALLALTASTASTMA